MKRGLGRVYQRKHTGAWWVQYYCRGRVIRESSGSERQADAVRLLKKRHAEMGQGKLLGRDAEKVTFEDLAQLIVLDYRINGRKSLVRVEDSLIHLRKAFGYDRAVDISSDRITKYVCDRQVAGAAPATVLQEVACLRRSFNLALRSGKLTQKPYFPTIKLSNVRKGFFEPREVEALLKYLPEEVGTLIQFLYLTGWRIGEAMPLKWSQVDFDAGVVRLEPGTTKNLDGREFPFSALPPLAALLKRQRDLTTALEREQGRVIPHVFHRGGEPIRFFRTAWKNACRDAGLLGRIPHDLRRSAVRAMERAGVPRSVAMRLSGHKTESIYRRYAIVDEADLRDGVAKLAEGSRQSALGHKPVVQASGRTRMP